MAILAIHTDCFKLLILAISCKNLGDEYLDTTAFAAYIQANPAARERVEAAHLLAQLDDMRRRGVLATA